MPNTKSAKKAMRVAERRRVINTRTKAKVKNTTKVLKKAVTDKNVAEAIEALKKAMSALDKAAKKGVLHKNTASRKKSRMAKAINKIES